MLVFVATAVVPTLVAESVSDGLTIAGLRKTVALGFEQWVAQPTPEPGKVKSLDVVYR